MYEMMILFPIIYLFAWGFLTTVYNCLSFIIYKLTPFILCMIGFYEIFNLIKFSNINEMMILLPIIYLFGLGFLSHTKNLKSFCIFRLMPICLSILGFYGMISKFM